MKQEILNLLGQAGFKENGIKGLRRFYKSDEDFEAAVSGLSAICTPNKKAQLHQLLSQRRGGGKFDHSVFNNTGKARFENKTKNGRKKRE